MDADERKRIQLAANALSDGNGVVWVGRFDDLIGSYFAITAVTNAELLQRRLLSEPTNTKTSKRAQERPGFSNLGGLGGDSRCRPKQAGSLLLHDVAASAGVHLTADDNVHSPGCLAHRYELLDGLDQFFLAQIYGRERKP